MRRAATLAIVLALGACNKEGSTIVVTVDSTTPVQATQLAVSVTEGGHSKSFTVPVSGGMIPPDVVFAVQFAPGTTGTVQFDITTDSTPPIAITATASLSSSGRVDLPVMLPTVSDNNDLGGGGGGPDLASPADMVIVASCPGVCGNGVRDCMEGCDDGNTTSGDGCSASCTVEASTLPVLVNVPQSGNLSAMSIASGKSTGNIYVLNWNGGGSAMPLDRCTSDGKTYSPNVAAASDVSMGGVFSIGDDIYIGGSVLANPILNKLWRLTGGSGTPTNVYSQNNGTTQGANFGSFAGDTNNSITTYWFGECQGGMCADQVYKVTSASTDTVYSTQTGVQHLWVNPNDHALYAFGGGNMMKDNGSGAFSTFAQLTGASIASATADSEGYIYLLCSGSCATGSVWVTSSTASTKKVFVDGSVTVRDLTYEPFTNSLLLLVGQQLLRIPLKHY